MNKSYLKEIIIKYRRVLVILAHLGIIFLSYLLSFYLRFEFNIPRSYLDIFKSTVLIILFIKIIIFYYFGLLHGMWRYVSMSDLWQILKAGSISTGIFAFLLVFIERLSGFPRSIFVLDWLICICFLSGIRFFARLFRERLKPSISKKKRNALIVGAGEAGILMLKECRNNVDMGIRVAGFIDDDPVKKTQIIYGVRVLGNKKDIPDIINSLNIEEIILAIPSANGETIRDILSYCQVPDVKIKTIPGLSKIVSGELEIKPRDVKPDDLLGREMVQIDKNEINSYIRRKKILVTGAGGSIGSEICRQLVQFSPSEIILFDYNENDTYFLEVEFRSKYPFIKFKTIIGDIKDIGLLKHTFSSYKPEVVFHSAAHKHVQLMEFNPAAAVKNNIIGTRNIIYAADHYKVERFILISTDKAVNPISIMGMSKRIAEMIMQVKSKKSKTKFLGVRFGNVIGSAGSIVPLFKRQIEDGGPLTITHPEAKRYFMSVSEAALLVLQAGALGNGGEIFILDMGQQIKITDLANNLVALSGLVPGKDIQFKFIGLRQGEKLSEEILLNTELDKVTKHNKIYVAQPNNFEQVKLRNQVKELERLAVLMKEKEIIRKMKEVVGFADKNE